MRRCVKCWVTLDQHGGARIFEGLGAPIVRAFLRKKDGAFLGWDNLRRATLTYDDGKPKPRRRKGVK